MNERAKIRSKIEKAVKYINELTVKGELNCRYIAGVIDLLDEVYKTVSGKGVEFADEKTEDTESDGDKDTDK